jgi:ABC-2 type transport system ATP-binding protein
VSSDTALALRIDGLGHNYGDRAALVDVSFSADTGSILALLGPNGGGKTTLFGIITTLLSTTPGHAHVFGHDVAVVPDQVRQLMGVVFQSPALDTRLTVEENLTAHGHLYGLRGAHLRSRLSAVLEMVGLQDRSRDVVGTLSGGLQRRVEIAKALLPEPRLLVLDEPSTGLDPGARRELWDHLVGLRDTLGTTVILTTHLMDEAARSDNVALLHEGRLVALGAPKVLVTEVGGDVVLIASDEAESLARDIRGRFNQTVEVVDGQVRIERTNGHQLIGELVEAFPGRINGMTYGKPTLEDVFLHHTGQRLDS